MEDVPAEFIKSCIQNLVIIYRSMQILIDSKTDLIAGKREDTGGTVLLS